MTGYKKVFLDTPAFIYLLEDHPVFGLKVASILDHCLQSGVELSTSVITWMEFCVKPYELNKTGVIGQFRELLNDLDIILHDINPDIAEQAARLRSLYHIKPMDALQIAASRHSGCDGLVTNDKRLAEKVKESNFIMISDWI